MKPKTPANVNETSNHGWLRRFVRRPGRNLNVNGVKWKYVMGRESVVAYSDDGQRRCEQAWRIKGQSDPNLFGRGQWKKTSDGMLLPSEIVAWLKSPNIRS